MHYRSISPHIYLFTKQDRYLFIILSFTFVFIFWSNFPKYLRLIIDLIPFQLFGLTKVTISTSNKGKSRIDRL